MITMQKTISFRPLRRIKKTGRIAVASYMQWYKVKCADYSKFTLIVDDEYKTLPPDEYVYNHKGERLFWRDYNPADIAIYYYEVFCKTHNLDTWDECMEYFENLGKENKTNGYGIIWRDTNRVNYNCKGLDCTGTPTFSHGTDQQLLIHNNYSIKSISEFEPLTVRIVTKWFGWFLYQLENSHLKV